MTNLEKLIDGAASRGFVEQLRTAMEQAGIEFAKELMADPDFRQTVRAFVQTTTARLREELSAPAPAPRRRARKGAR